MADEKVEGVIKLEHTPTWVVATVCSVIVAISLVAERVLHYLGKYLLKKNQKALYQALLKVKEELMLLGFISVLLTVFQGAVQSICIPKILTHYMLPCRKEFHRNDTSQREYAFFSGIFSSRRRLLAQVAESGERHCARKGKVPLLSIEALHQLDLFIFVLAITHVTFSVLTILLSGAKISLWKHWEDSIQKDDSGAALNNVSQFEFLSKRFKGFGKESMFKSWLHSFGKQFYGSVTELDYTALRLGFITMHFRGNPKFNFHNYMTRVLEADFKRVVGIRWYLWIFVFIFLLLNVNSWHTYFWIAFIPLILLLSVGTKLEHVITQLAHEVADNIAFDGNLVVKPSDDHFWFKRPRIVLYLLHIILFQNAFEIAFFFWILTTVGFNSCFMGQVGFIIPRFVIGVIIQLLCSYSTLPLYALVTQMGSTFKKQIFDEHVQEGILGWAQKVKQRRSQNLGNGSDLQWNVRLRGDTGIHLQNMAGPSDALMEEGNAGIPTVS